MKTCPDCGQNKALIDFGDNVSRPDGKACYCRECFRVRAAVAYRRKAERQGRTVRERVEVPEGHKFCPKCREIKPLDAFHRAPRQAGGRSSYCGACKYARDNETRFRKVYGISTSDRDDMIEAQGGLCGLCCSAPAVHVDHDHTTGQVRGVLCFSCNVAIGHLKDSADLMRRAIDYLETPTWQRTLACTAASRLTSLRLAPAPSRTSSA